MTDLHTLTMVALAAAGVVQSARLRHAHVEWAREARRRLNADRRASDAAIARNHALDDAAYWEAEANHHAAVALALTDRNRVN